MGKWETLPRRWYSQLRPSIEEKRRSHISGALTIRKLSTDFKAESAKNLQKLARKAQLIYRIADLWASQKDLSISLKSSEPTKLPVDSYAR